MENNNRYNNIYIIVLESNTHVHGIGFLTESRDVSAIGEAIRLGSSYLPPSNASATTHQLGHVEMKFQCK